MSIKMVHETTNIEEKCNKSRPQSWLQIAPYQPLSVALMLSNMYS